MTKLKIPFLSCLEMFLGEVLRNHAKYLQPHDVCCVMFCVHNRETCFPRKQRKDDSIRIRARVHLSRMKEQPNSYGTRRLCLMLNVQYWTKISSNSIISVAHLVI